ncbi:MAG: vitamin K epoxide reductase family protein [Candidatus Aenigmatarchaeota archaeon]
MIYQKLLIFLCILGILFSAYILYVQESSKNVYYCNINDFLSCDKVIYSEYNNLFGIPLPILSIIWFFGILVLSLLKMYSIIEYLVLASLMFIGYLVYVEIFILASICILCTIAHIIGISILYPVRKLKNSLK